jgi:hypothetical protein
VYSLLKKTCQKYVLWTLKLGKYGNSIYASSFSNKSKIRNVS